ncbi:MULTISPECIES: hypothetical protein [Streptococcus]|uniref:hypothetical protein n=1 Tax=Streptococcus TaxID=1301 RepID=UPI0003FBB99A|nr:hypothetical protein [Streptococcus suis]MBM0195984.1 hypothetical protein [Streptococcus suis]MBM7317451.1 hypothetical protein [Streptococcus suis]NQM01960.1 hypothetical protein [Streptococcus suis]HEM2785971.1 hypothetical protein [Streptococcus suis]HEM4137518.1 hypothetical protein [Streptococcus suis]
MAFDEGNRENIYKALDFGNQQGTFPDVQLPTRTEHEKVSLNASIDRENKEKLIRMAERQGYGKSTSAFLNDWIASVKE